MPTNYKLTTQDKIKCTIEILGYIVLVAVLQVALYAYMFK